MDGRMDGRIMERTVGEVRTERAMYERWMDGWLNNLPPVEDD